MSLDLVVSRIEMEWVRRGKGAPCSLSIKKVFGDGTVVQLFLTEAEAAYISQLITTGKDNPVCVL